MEPSNQSQPVEGMERTSPPTPVSAPEEKTKKSKAPKVLAVLLVLALVACGVLGWLLYDQSDKSTSINDKVAAKDSEIAQLKADLKSAKDAAKDAKESNETTTDTSNTTNDMIVEKALTFAKAMVANQGFPEGSSDLRAEIDKQTTMFTRVQVGSSAGPGVGLVYFKKVGADWVLIGNDNGNPDRFAQTFGMPKDF